ncbi:MAG: hypothetical protein ACR2MO_11010 [Acidimicrobiales bacterium]
MAAPSSAGAQTPEGVGTSKASQTLIDLVLGDGSLLDVKVLGDTAQSTIDSALAPASAVTKLVPLSLTSSVIPGLSGIVGNLPTFESKTPGGNPAVTGSALDLASPGGVLGLPLGLLGGSIIPTSLTSALDGTGARTGLDSALANLSLVTGLLKVNSVSNKQGTAAALSNANGNRALTVDAISLLSLGDLLAGLNLDLAKLPLSTVSTLLSALQLPLALPGGAADLKSAVDGLTGTITGILGQVAGNNALLGSVVNSLPGVSGLLGGLSLTSLIPLGGTSLVPVDLTALGLGTVSQLLGTLQGTLASLLNTALGTLGNLSLLKLDGATIGATTKAADTLANSAADVTGKLGGLSVLGLNLPGLDLLSVGNTVNAVTTQLGNVLGIIDPSLKDLVKVGVLDKSTSVTAANGYNNAIAGIDILSLKITPPALLSNLIGTLTGNGALSSLGALTGAGLTPAALPVLGSLGGNILGLGNLLGGITGVLTKGLTLKVGSVQSASQFRVASAPAPAQVAAPVESLPRTGADTRTLGILAAGMAALALGVRRWARRPEAMMD